MKQLSIYIIEQLKNDVHKWIENIYNTQKTLIKDNKVDPIDVDVNNLNKPKNPFLYDDFFNDALVKQFIGNKLIGFTVTNQMIRNPKQYIYDKDKKMNPECLPYWYKEGDNIYFIGLTIYDKSIYYINNYMHLIDIESSLIVAKSDVLMKTILNDFIKLINIKGKYEGITVKPMHPKMKANFIKLGFRPMQDNKEILTYKLN